MESCIITKAHIVCHIGTKLNPESDGNLYIVRETGFSSGSEKTAINNAFAYIRKQVRRELRLLNKAQPKGAAMITTLKRIEPLRPQRLRTTPLPVKQVRIRTIQPGNAFDIFKLKE